MPEEYRKIVKIRRKASVSRRAVRAAYLAIKREREAKEADQRTEQVASSSRK